jgi:NAD(P)H-flavin reductase
MTAKIRAVQRLTGDTLLFEVADIDIKNSAGLSYRPGQFYADAAGVS